MLDRNNWQPVPSVVAGCSLLPPCHMYLILFLVADIFYPGRQLINRGVVSALIRTYESSARNKRGGVYGVLSN